MRINEIEYGHWNKPSWQENAPFQDPQYIGKFDGYDIYNQDDYYFIPSANMSYLGYVRVEETGEFRELYVPEKNRRRGIASSIILFLLRELNTALILTPDEIITDDSRRVFYTLAKAGKVKITNNGEPLPLSKISEIFADTADSDLQLVIESKKKAPKTACFELYNPSTGLAGASSIKIGESTREELWFD